MLIPKKIARGRPQQVWQAVVSCQHLLVLASICLFWQDQHAVVDNCFVAVPVSRERMVCAAMFVKH